MQEHTEFSEGNGPAEGALSSQQGHSHLGLPQGSSGFTGAAGRTLPASVPGYTQLLLCEQCPSCASFLVGKIITIGKQLVIM